MDLIKSGVITPAYAQEYANLPASNSVHDEVFYEDLIVEDEEIILLYHDLFD